MKLRDVLKWLSFGTAVATGIWTVSVYRSDVVREARKPIWEKELSTYFSIAETASTLSFYKPETTDTEVEQARRKFWELYNGSGYVLVTHTGLIEAMTEMGRCIPEPGFEKAQQHCSPSTLQERARKISVFVRDAIGSSWNQPLGSYRANMHK